MATKRTKVSARQSRENEIDRDKLRAAIRHLDGEYAYYMLDEAIDLLPQAKLVKLVSQYIDLRRLRPDGLPKGSLLDEVRAFDAAARAGKYYESFNVNSRNFMEKSAGTLAFIADCHRLLKRCVMQSRKGDAIETRAAIETVLNLLRYIDEWNADVIFFADEAAAWQVGVDWPEVLPALFRCLSKTTEPEEYARYAVEVIEEFDKPGRERHLAAAERFGTAAQRKALRSLAS